MTDVGYSNAHDQSRNVSSQNNERLMAQHLLHASDTRAVRYVLRLANAKDVERVPPRVAEALWRGYRRQFLDLPPDPLGKWPGIGMKPRPDVRAMQLHQLGAIQQTARELLTEVSAGNEVRTTATGTCTFIGDRFSFRTADPVEGFRVGLTWLLTGGAARTIRQCPECRRYFVRVRRQKYCSDQCTDRATWRNYPEAKKRRARQKQYDKYGWTLGARSKRR
jgi:hypothetical protein